METQNQQQANVSGPQPAGGWVGQKYKTDVNQDAKIYCWQNIGFACAPPPPPGKANPTVVTGNVKLSPVSPCTALPMQPSHRNTLYTGCCHRQSYSSIALHIPGVRDGLPNVYKTWH